MLSQNYEFEREIINWLLKKKGNMKPGQISKRLSFKITKMWLTIVRV